MDQQFLEFPEKKGKSLRNTQIVQRFLPGISVQSDLPPGISQILCQNVRFLNWNSAISSFS